LTANARRTLGPPTIRLHQPTMVAEVYRRRGRRHFSYENNPVMVLAVGAALAGAVCCAVAAALQHREAVSLRSAEAVGLRLLWALARRPSWLVGVAALLAAGLHAVALLNGPLTLVQPLGVSAVVFAVPVAALFRKYRIRVWELLAAATVVAGLIGLLTIAPSRPVSNETAGTALTLAIVTVLVVATVTVLAARRRMVLRGLLLAVGAGIALGVTAVLLQVVLFDVQRTGPLGLLSVTTLAMVVLAVAGVWLNQQAYRAGKVAVVLAVVTVTDPAVTAITAVVLGERFATDVLSLGLLVVSVAVIAGGIAWLARSPAHTV
jgi:drug/metabolite transporter (DMT)-like permease